MPTELASNKGTGLTPEPKIHCTQNNQDDQFQDDSQLTVLFFSKKPLLLPTPSVKALAHLLSWGEWAFGCELPHPPGFG